MISKKSAASAIALVSAFAVAGVALAQTPPAAPRPAAPGPAALPVTHGPALPNVCIYNAGGAMGASAVGKFVESRLETIVKTANAELQGEETAIQNEAKAIDAASKTPTADQTALKKRALDLEERYAKFRAKAELRQREVQATEQKARVRIAQEMDPIIKAVYQQKGCSILLERNAVLLANPAMDITPAVVAGTDAKIKQFTFDRERLDAPRPAAPIAAPAKPN